MRNKFFLIFVLSSLFLGIVFYFLFLKKSPAKKLKVSSTKKSMIIIKSPAFSQGGMIPVRYTCKGENISPPLVIENVPKEAKSLVLIVDDPDAPFGTFTHWLVWNIDPSINKIEEGKTPSLAVEGQNDFGQIGYGGPCPPSGTHRYFFKIFALDTTLSLSSGAKREDLEKAIENHILDQGSLMGKFSQ